MNNIYGSFCQKIHHLYECSLWGDGEASSAPLLFLTSPWEEERARGTESLSEKKAIWEHRLKLSQWEQSVPLRAASMWDFPKHDTYSAWASSACREDTEFGWHGICNNTMKFALLVRLFGSTPDGCRGWQSPQAGYCEVLIRLFEAFQRRIPASAKKRVRRWREEI